MLKQFDSAFQYNEQSRSLVEKIYASANNQQIAFLETVYEVEKEEQRARQAYLTEKGQCGGSHCHCIGGGLTDCIGRGDH
ncbi:hypothetical protein [Paraflavitalea speifideaquila]|uniref:hypothetical protein n=1 Tax=Paraflavitalea speifideaquila TaxID=3076558 RepID=UPI0028E752CC|nr:hypothetical protein [Paraflavitalea speifideiaquila]